LISPFHYLLSTFPTIAHNTNKYKYSAGRKEKNKQKQMTIASKHLGDKTQSGLFTSTNSLSKENKNGQLLRNKQGNNSTANTTTEQPSQLHKSDARDMGETNEICSVASLDNPTKLFSFVSSRNWAGVIKRCMGEDKKEVSTWIVEKNNDGSTRWKLLPIHKVSLTKKEEYANACFYSLTIHP
jgi:hypothetical protein